MKKLNETKRFSYYGLDLEVRIDHNWIVTDSTGFIKTSKDPFKIFEENGVWLSTNKDSHDPITFVCKVDLDGVSWKSTMLPLREGLVGAGGNAGPTPSSHSGPGAASLSHETDVTWQVPNPAETTLLVTSLAGSGGITKELTVSELLEKAFELSLQQGLILENVEFNSFANSAMGSGRQDIILKNAELRTYTLERRNERSYI